MVVRCKYDAVMPPADPKGEPDVFVNIRSLNEWDPKVPNTHMFMRDFFSLSLSSSDLSLPLSLPPSFP